MHRMCSSCGKHFIGNNKDMIIECKALRHTIISVADEWDSEKTFDPINLKMNEYDEEWHNKQGTMLARIIARGDLETYDEVVTYQCRICNSALTFKADDSREVPEAPKCQDCSVKMKREESACKVKLIRSLILQEPFGEAKHMTPMTMESVITGDLTKQVYIGQDKILSGTFTAVKKKNGTNKIVFDVTRLSDVDEKKDTLPTDEEITKYKEMMKEDWIVKLTDSFAPEIWGLQNEKEALILSLVSGEKIGDLRGDINTLLVGDPSTAKSRLLKYVLKVTSKSAYALGRSTSAAGLVMGIDKLADGRNVIKAGPVVLCHKGCVCIDEIDKMADQDRSALHEVMEQQSATLNKIGSNLTLPAETIIIAAANPRTSKYNTGLSISQNINMPDSLLSRFDLIFLIRDIADKDIDIKKLRHIAKVRQNKNDCEVLDIQEMTKLINYAKKFNPTVEHENMKMLEDFFVELRGYEQTEDSLSIDMRGFEGLIRLATAHAKLRFCDKIEKKDIEEAIRLYRYSLETFGMKTKKEMDMSKIPDNFSKEDYVIQTIKNHCNNEDKFDLEVLCEKLADTKWFKTPQSAMKYVMSLNNQQGILLEQADGMYKYVH